jgi:hypothetical protein
MLDGQMPVPAMMINPSDPDQKYGVSHILGLILIFSS